MGKILFVTGTDTGVGKTLVTASLVCHLRKRGLRALGMKPFCSGRRDDVRLIQAKQPGEISDEEANPFYFRVPLAPLAAARKAGKVISIDRVLAAINRLSERCDMLIVEGAGGLLAPLGENFNALDLISRLGSQVLVVAANKLGVINHVRLTLAALQGLRTQSVKVLLTQTTRSTDPSMRTNPSLLTELVSPVPVLVLPWVGPHASTPAAIQRNERKTRRTLESVLRK